MHWLDGSGRLRAWPAAVCCACSWYDVYTWTPRGDFDPYTHTCTAGCVARYACTSPSLYGWAWVPRQPHEGIFGRGKTRHQRVAKVEIDGVNKIAYQGFKMLIGVEARCALRLHCACCNGGEACGLKDAILLTASAVQTARQSRAVLMCSASTCVQLSWVQAVGGTRAVWCMASSKYEGTVWQ